MEHFLDAIKNRILIFDGSKGYLLQKMGLTPDDCSEHWNITHSDLVRKACQMYKDAGSDVIQTNTFPGNRIFLDKYSLGEQVYDINFQGARIAREVMGDDGYVAASIGPTGKLFEPSGELTFSQAFEVFKEQVQAVVDGGVDMINFETFTDIAEMRAALLAAREVTDLPLVCSMSFDANGKTLMGSDPGIVVNVLKSLGADMVGTNCSFGPEQQADIIRKMSEAGAGYLSVKPNAGLPEMVDDKVVYKELPCHFASLSGEFAAYGARLIGGCCGTTPEFIQAIKESLQGVNIPDVTPHLEKAITSTTQYLFLERGHSSALDCVRADMESAPSVACTEYSEKFSVGYLSADPGTDLYRALKAGNMEAVVDASLDIASEGYDAVCIDIDAVQAGYLMLSAVVDVAQGYIRAPIIIRTSDPVALDLALRIYKGRAGVVAKSSDEGIVEQISKMAEKYGSVIMCV